MSKINSKAVKSFAVRVNLEGQGIVNYDSEEQKFFAGKVRGMNYDQNSNVLYAKKAFVKNNEKEGNKIYDYQLKISNQCIRHALFGDTIGAEVFRFYRPACAYIASPNGYIRGYMSADEDDKFKFHKSSCVTILDAIDENAVIASEFFNHSGKRDSTSIYKRETTGKTHYKMNAYFNVKEAQFLCNDNVTTEPALSIHYIENKENGVSLLENAFVKHYGRVPYTEGVFTSTSKLFDNDNGRYGFKMDDKFINEIFNNFLHMLLDFEIMKTNAYVKTASIEIKPIYDGTEDGEWITVTKDNVDSLTDFQYYQFYTEGDIFQWKKQKEYLENLPKKGKKKNQKSESKENEE